MDEAEAMAVEGLGRWIGGNDVNNEDHGSTAGRELFFANQRWKILKEYLNNSKR